MRKQSQLYAYLESLGVLEHGSDEDIALAKKQYWASIRKEWRKQQRKECKSYAVFFTKSEQRLIVEAARKRKIPVTPYIKQAALNMVAGSNTVDTRVIGEVRELLYLFFECIKSNEVNEEVQNQFIRLEQNVLQLLRDQ